MAGNRFGQVPHLCVLFKMSNRMERSIKREREKKRKREKERERERDLSKTNSSIVVHLLPCCEYRY